MTLGSWVMAARPKTLTAAIVPIVVGTSLAFANTLSVSWVVVICTIIGSIAIQIATNLFNDALDFVKGADNKQRIGPTRVTQSGAISIESVMWSGYFSITIALLASIPLVMIGGWPIAILAIISAVCAYLYTGGPYPLAYHGLGDLFVYLFFGLIATMTVYFLHTGEITLASFIAGTQIGLLATAMIAINNLRDIKGDTAANKRTLPVRFGKTFGRVEIALLLILPFSLQAFWFQSGYDYAALMPYLPLPLAAKTIQAIWREEPSRMYNQYLGWTAMIHLLFGLMLSIGLILL